MIKRFDIGGTLVANTPVVYRLYNAAENANYYDKDGAANTTGLFLGGMFASASAAVKVEVGLANTDGTSFTPYYTMYLAAGQPGDRDMTGSSGPDVPTSATRVLAVRLTSVPGGATFVGGDVDLFAR